MFHLLGYPESCEVLQGRLPEPAVHSSRQPVWWSLCRLLGNCEHNPPTVAHRNLKTRESVMPALASPSLCHRPSLPLRSGNPCPSLRAHLPALPSSDRLSRPR